MTLATLGFALGLAVSAMTSSRGPVDGMCIALDMAMGHGLIDEVQRARVEDAISSPSNPYFDRVSVKRSELRRACRRIAAGRWNW